MISDEMPFLCHAPDDLLLAGNIFPDEKKRRLHVPLLQAVQKQRRIGFMGTIVKGDGHPGRQFLSTLRLIFLRYSLHRIPAHPDSGCTEKYRRQQNQISFSSLHAHCHPSSVSLII